MIQEEVVGKVRKSKDELTFNGHHEVGTVGNFTVDMFRHVTELNNPALHDDDPVLPTLTPAGHTQYGMTNQITQRQVQQLVKDGLIIPEPHHLEAPWVFTTNGHLQCSIGAIDDGSGIGMSCYSSRNCGRANISEHNISSDD